MGPFDPAFDELPGQAPIFPLPGALLLPGGQLPLRIFEPRYLAMFDHALAGNRLVGMIQPQDEGEDFSRSKLYGTGCLGRVTSFSETDEGHYMVTLTGLIRFKANQELEPLSGYRRLAINCNPFRGDYDSVDRESADGQPLEETLLREVKRYFESKGYDADWSSLERTPRHQITTTLSMICPFDSVEKQALIEAETHTERLELLIGLMKMDSLSGGSGGTEIN